MRFTESLKAYFEKFGEVSNCVLKKDQETGKPRGFGFVTYADPSNVDKVCSKFKFNKIVLGKIFWSIDEEN